MANGGNIIFGVRVVDESKVDMTRYVSWDDHQALRQQLREAKSEAEEWEERYEALLDACGGVWPG